MNNSKTPMLAEDYKEGVFNQFKSDYKVYPELTAKLDSFQGSFDAQTVNEMVLWKVARYVILPPDLLKSLDRLRTLKPKDHRQAEKLITALQGVKGVQLPMASTFLRFANPKVFQIIDGHAYRAVYGSSYIAAKRHKKIQDMTRLYCDYLDKLHDLCALKDFNFCDADRVLFEFDKLVNPPLNAHQQEALE